MCEFIKKLIRPLPLISFILLTSFLYTCSPLPVIETFGGRKSIEIGREVKLSWKVKKAKKIEIEGIQEDLPLEGKLKLKPDSNTRYTLIAYGKDEKKVQKSIQVKVYKRDARIKYFEGDSITTDEKPLKLYWKVENAAKVRIEGVAKGLEEVGEIEVNPYQDTTYTLVVEDRYGKEIKAKKTVKVDFVEKFEGPDFVVGDEGGILEWKIKQVPFVTIQGVGDSLPSDGKVKVYPKEETGYTLKAIRKNGEKVEKTVMVNFTEPYVAYFKDRKEIQEDGSDKVFLKWNIRGVKEVNIAGLNDHLPAKGQLELRPVPKKSRNYTLSFNYHGKTIQTIYFVQINDAPLMVDAPSKIFRGEEVALKWRARGGEKVTIEGIGSDFESRGEITVKPHHTQTYRFSIQKKKKRIVEEHTVRVVRKNFIKNTIPGDKTGKNHRLYFDIFTYDRSNYPKEIKLYVMVTDSLGNFISNLAPPYIDEAKAREYFMQVVETVNHRAYPIKDFKIREVREQVSKPYDISVVMDYSGSMVGAIGALENSVETFFKSKHGDDRVSLVKFDDHLLKEFDLTQSESELLQKFKKEGLTRLGGNTALYAGGDEGLKTLKESKNNKVLLLFTDGHENASFKHSLTHAFRASHLVKNARQNNTRIYTIAYGEGVNDDLLDMLSTLGDGQMYYVDKPSDIKGVYKELPRIFRNYYEISFKPVPVEGTHEISLVYNNQVTGADTTSGKTHIGENYDIDQYEFEDDYTYNTTGRRKPVTPPQAIAYFDYNEFTVKEKYKPYLQTFITYMAKNKTSVLEVHGHTDLEGTVEGCQRLSENRALAIKKYFINKGVKQDRITIKGFGKTKPLWAKEEYDWQAKENRRIELLLLE